MNHGRGVARVACVVALMSSLALTACGGGGSGTSGNGIVPGPTATSTPGSSAQAVKGTATVDVPTTTASAAKRKPFFVSPSTNGATLVAKDHTSGSTVLNQTYDLSSTSGNCTGSSPRTCSMTFAVVPGTYDWTLTLYDEAPVSGAIPVGAKSLGVSTITAAITVNSSNTIAFSVSATVSGAPGVTCSPTACGSLTYYSLPADGASHTFPFAVTFYDPDGNAITGSIPFTSPVSVTLTEPAGKTGHSYLSLNGTNVGTSASMTKATDSLALVYDGKASTGYTTTTNIGGTAVVLSPMYLGASGPPTALSITKLSQTVTDTIAEQSAPAGIAYSSATSGTCAQITSQSATGSGASATESVTTSSAAGTSKTCTVNVTDTDGSVVPLSLNFSVSGPISCGTPTFSGGGGSGTCSAGLAFTGASQTATITVSDPLYTGTITAASGNTGIATTSISGSGASETLTITAVAAGSTSVTLTDTTGNSLAINVGVTTSGGTVQ